MSLFNLMSLDDAAIENVTAVVQQWCEKYKVSISTERGQAAMNAAINRALSGEKSPAALLEAISIEMRLQQYRQPIG